MQTAVVDTKSALSRILAHVQTEEAERAQQGLAILLACALGEWNRKQHLQAVSPCRANGLTAYHNESAGMTGPLT